MKYGYIVDYLCETVGPAIEGQGADHDRVNKRTEAGIAMAFRRYICGMDGDTGCDYIKMCEDGRIYMYNGQYFVAIEEECLQEIIVEVMERMDVGIVYRMNSAKAIKEFCKNKLVADERCKWEPDRRWVVFTNGVFDTKTGNFVDFSVEYKTDIVMNYAYRSDATSALWDKFLIQTVPDENARETLHQFCGCFLANRKEYKIEHLCFVIGEGRNGKSVLCKALVSVFDQSVVSSYTPQQLFKDSSVQAAYRMADINGKIANYCDDVSNSDFSGGELKAFVSGGEFTGRSPYSKKPTKLTKVPLMLCCANAIPPTTDDSDGFFRRFLIIEAPNQVDERDIDTTLEQKLSADDVKAAIFNWIYDGYKAFVANGGKISVAKTVKDIVEQMKKNANSLRRWISEFGYGAVKPNGSSDPNWKSLKEICSMYAQYCNDFGETPKARRAVTELLDKMGVKKERRSTGTWYCLGVVEQVEDKSDDLPIVQFNVEDKGGEDIPF